MHEKYLKLLLQGFGVLCCLAIVAFVMPASWFHWCHQQLDMGDFPEQPVAEYLARATSGLVTFMGILALVIATDVRGYSAVIRLLAISLVVLEIINLVFGFSAGMPAWWIWSDALGAIAFSAVVIYLQNKINTAPSTVQTEQGAGE